MSRPVTTRIDGNKRRRRRRRRLGGQSEKILTELREILRKKKENKNGFNLQPSEGSYGRWLPYSIRMGRKIKFHRLSVKSVLEERRVECGRRDLELANQINKQSAQGRGVDSIRVTFVFVDAWRSMVFFFFLYLSLFFFIPFDVVVDVATFYGRT